MARTPTDCDWKRSDSWSRRGAQSPECELDEFEETYRDGVARIRIGLKSFQIDPSEGWE